jgi:drug/metabolite transporter (DMT)-like permease
VTLALFVVLVTAASLVSAWLTVQVRAGAPWWLPVLGGLASYVCWAGATKLTSTNLVVLSALFDVVVALAWFAGFVWFGGERISTPQWFGIALLCAGLVLINAK